jgi:serine/threonine-protein kinase RsbW
MISSSATFPARFSALAEIKSMLDAFGAKAALAHEDLMRLTLIVEELFINTVSHGHGADCDAPVTLALRSTRARVTLTYRDCAPPFNPLTASHSTDVESNVEERRIGGLGVLITLAMSRHARYSFTEGRNQVELTLSRSNKI